MQKHAVLKHHLTLLSRICIARFPLHETQLQLWREKMCILATTYGHFIMPAAKQNVRHMTVQEEEEEEIEGEQAQEDEKTAEKRHEEENRDWQTAKKQTLTWQQHLPSHNACTAPSLLGHEG